MHDRIRGLSPHPGAWFEIELNGKRERIKVLRSTLVARKFWRARHAASTIALTVACGEGAVRLTEVQRAGRKPMPADEFLRGVKLRAGAVLG